MSDAFQVQIFEAHHIPMMLVSIECHWLGQIVICQSSMTWNNLRVNKYDLDQFEDYTPVIY